jgi:hypothetical protein
MSSKLITLLVLVLLVAARCTSTPCPILLLCLLDQNSECALAAIDQVFCPCGKRNCMYVRTHSLFVCRALWWCRGNQCTCLFILSLSRLLGRTYTRCRPSTIGLF